MAYYILARSEILAGLAGKECSYSFPPGKVVWGDHTVPLLDMRLAWVYRKSLVVDNSLDNVDHYLV